VAENADEIDMRVAKKPDEIEISTFLSEKSTFVACACGAPCVFLHRLLIASNYLPSHTHP
jgi:hypothetical protein